MSVLPGASVATPATVAAGGPSCLACGGATSSVLSDLFDTRFGVPGSYEIRICGECELEQIHPRLSPEDLAGVYEAYYNFRGVRDSGYAAFREWFLGSALYRLWMAIDGDIAFHANKGRGALLDLGCNEGRGLVFFRKNGFDAEGVEINSRAADIARSKGFRVFSQLPPANPLASESGCTYDVVVLSNVLEHSLDPVAMMAHVNGLLKEHGEVWISCPNAESWARAAFGRFWINWHPPFHIVHFSQRTLANLLRTNGFEIRKLKFATPSLWIAQSIVSALWSKRGQSNRFMRRAFLVASLMMLIRTLLFPILWFANFRERGDCMLVFAVKSTAVSYFDRKNA